MFVLNRDYIHCDIGKWLYTHEYINIAKDAIGIILHMLSRFSSFIGKITDADG